MNWAAIVAALFQLGVEIAEKAQLSNDDLKKAVEEGIDRESDVQRAMDIYHALIKKD